MNRKKENKLVVFEDKEIRHTWYKGDWWFSVVDVVGVLVGNVNYRRYWSDLKIKLKEEGFQLYDIIVQLKLEAPDGKMRETDCANKQGLFRIIQSIPSKKVEPFKLWLAKIGSERIDEIENPELAQERMKKLYEEKGYSKSWIDKRIRGIAIRADLTDEWKNRGVEENKDFAILTNEISKATFGMTPMEYKNFKNIPKRTKANLRDNMSDWELIFTMIGEKTTIDISKQEKPNTFNKNKKVVRRGGNVAKKARDEVEKEIGRSTISDKNYLHMKETKLIGGNKDE